MTVWLLSTCVLIAVLMLLRRALRGRADPRLVYALWLLAAVVSWYRVPCSTCRCPYPAWRRAPG